jgi:hypothetical protein
MLGGGAFFFFAAGLNRTVRMKPEGCGFFYFFRENSPVGKNLMLS